VLWKGLHAKFAGQVGEAILGRADPLAAEIQYLAADLLAECSAADAIPRLQHDERASTPIQLASRDEASYAGTDDDDIDKLRAAHSSLSFAFLVGLLRSRRKILMQIASQQFVQMPSGVFALEDAMRAVGIWHDRKGLVCGDKGVY